MVKCKVLLDEGFPPPTRFKNLNSYFDVKHIKQDLNLAGASDSTVYKTATQQQRVLITFNHKDFETLIQPQMSSVVGLSFNLSNEQIDLKLTSLLKRLPSKNRQGRMYKITSSTKVRGLLDKDSVG